MYRLPVHSHGGGGRCCPDLVPEMGGVVTWSRGEGGVVTWSQGGRGREVLWPGPREGGRCCPDLVQEGGRREVLSTPPWPSDLSHDACENITFAPFATRAVIIPRNEIKYSIQYSTYCWMWNESVLHIVQIRSPTDAFKQKKEINYVTHL